MRLIGTLENPSLCEKFSAYLNDRGIDHRIELVINKDWGSNHYGAAICQVWVVEEDRIDEAIEYLEAFKKNPQDEKFHVRTPGKKPLKPSPIKSIKPDKIISSKKPSRRRLLRNRAFVTTYLIWLCIIIYIWGDFTTPKRAAVSPAFSQVALYSPPINRELMYDWPKAYMILDKIVDLYGVKSLQNPQDLPPQGKILLNRYFHTLQWRGFYPKLLALLGAPQGKSTLDTPTFYQISRGEVWRLFTPALLHAGFFHILFNMIWLFILGRQMEERLKAARYIVFIVIAAVITSTFQYLMSGPDFLGISGVLTAMLGFIWVRQKIAPWEGYPLNPATLWFLAIFILAMFSIQVVDFFMQVFFNTSFASYIANTAHITGAALGIVMGRMKFFAWKT